MKQSQKTGTAGPTGATGLGTYRVINDTDAATPRTGLSPSDVILMLNTAGGDTQKVQASDVTSGDYFGASVAISGDTMVVGAYQEDTTGTAAGQVYVYLRTAGVWAEQQKFQASDAAAGDSFGYSVDIDGDTIVIGAPDEDTTGTDAGQVYVWTRSGTTWTEQQKFQASDAAASDDFGISVAISGDTVVAGSPDQDTTASNSGAIYVWTRSGTTWTEQQKIKASDAEANDDFGEEVAIDGDTIVVGAPDEDTTGAEAGSVYVYTRSGTTWTEQQKFQASDAAAGDSFGYSVDIDGDTIVVGAIYEDTTAPYAGQVYVWTRSGTTWTEQQKFQASDASASDHFGASVAISGDTVVAGADSEDTTGTDAGQVYVWTRSGTTWTEQLKLQSTDIKAADYFGSEVAIDGDTIAVGVAVRDSNTGVVYVGNVNEAEFIMPLSPSVGDQVQCNLSPLGWSIATINPNGNNIESGSASLGIWKKRSDASSASVTLVYASVSIGWVVLES